MKYLVKPFWYLMAIIHLIFKVSVSPILFFVSLLWNFSITDAIRDVRNEFNYFFTYSIYRGAIVIYRYKTMKDFVKGNKTDIHPFLQ